MINGGTASTQQHIVPSRFDIGAAGTTEKDGECLQGQNLLET